jgi:ectoine hydroxylase-related dioxygenase (phytanoyl-CoA dioxygenase family)
MVQNYVNQITKDGYAIIPNVISDRECEKYKKLLEIIYDKYSDKHVNSKEAGSLADKSLEKVVYNLHNKNLGWFKLFEHKSVLKVLDIILKKGSYKNNEPYYLNNISARCPLQGNQGQQIHLDSNLPGVNYNIITNVIWYFDDVNKENGTTIVVPRSHKLLRYADNTKKIKNKIYIKAKKGSILIFNANLWHGGSAKYNDESRWALVLGYARWFIKPSFDFVKNTPKKIYNKLNNKQKSLLGFDLVPPKDEFTRITRRSNFQEKPENYKLNV